MDLQEWYARLRKAPFSTAPFACLGDKRGFEPRTCESAVTTNINGINIRARNMAVEVALALGDGLGESVDGELMAKDRRRGDQVWERGKGRALRTCPFWLDCGLHDLDNSGEDAGSQTGAEFGFVGGPTWADCELSS